MTGFDELEAILAQVDNEPALYDRYSKIGNLPEFDRLKKTSFTMNEMIGDMFRNGYGLNGITYNNIEQVYNPLVSGVGSLHKQKQKLVSQGMPLALADHLCRKYLSEVSESSNVFALMDLFTSKEAKRALHRADTQIRDICLNFQTVDPTIPDL